MNYKLILGVVALLLAWAGCARRNTSTVSMLPRNVSVPVPILVDYPERGWKMFPAPTLAEGTGQIMVELPEEKGVIPRRPLKIVPATNIAFLPVIDYDKATEIRFGFLAKWLLMGRGIAISNHDEFATTTRVGIKYTDVVKEWYPDLDAVQSEVEKILPTLARSGPLVPKNSKHYVIAGCYLAKEVAFIIAKTNSLNLDLGAALTGLADLSGAVVRTNLSSYSLVTTFPSRQRVLYQPLALIVTEVGLDGSVRVKLEPVVSDALNPERIEFLSTNLTIRPQ